MNQTISFGLCAALALASGAAAQFTYVDADPSNTTLDDGTAYTPVASTAADGDWNARGFANGGSLYTSCDSGSENCPLLRTRISGLVAGQDYIINAHFWGADNQLWRGRAAAGSNPGIDPQGWNTNHFVGSSFTPATLLSDQATSTNGVNPAFELATDAAGIEIGGHFSNTVLIREADRYMTAAPMGVFTADANGNIDVYIDDLSNTSNGNRTWYDGVSYEAAPQSYGMGCGATVPAIGYTGTPNRTNAMTIDIVGGPANGLALLAIGFSELNPPIDLGAIGYSGCNLYANANLLEPVVLDATGAGNFGVTVNVVLPATIPLFWQWATWDSSANFSMTAALRTDFHN